MIVNKKQLYQLINKKREETQAIELFIVMRYGYDWEDLSKKPWAVEHYIVYSESDPPKGFMWCNDWDIGQNKFEIARIITDQEIIHQCIYSDTDSLHQCKEGVNDAKTQDS